MRKDMEISDSQVRTYVIKQLDLRKCYKKAREIYGAMHRWRAQQIQEFSLRETCPGMHKSVKFESFYNAFKCRFIRS